VAIISEVRAGQIPSKKNGMTLQYVINNCDTLLHKAAKEFLNLGKLLK